MKPKTFQRDAPAAADRAIPLDDGEPTTRRGARPIAVATAFGRRELVRRRDHPRAGAPPRAGKPRTLNADGEARAARLERTARVARRSGRSNAQWF